MTAGRQPVRSQPNLALAQVRCECPLLTPSRMFGLRGGNRSSCPTADLRGRTNERPPRWRAVSPLFERNCSEPDIPVSNKRRMGPCEIVICTTNECAALHFGRRVCNRSPPPPPLSPSKASIRARCASTRARRDRLRQFAMQRVFAHAPDMGVTGRVIAG